MNDAERLLRKVFRFGERAGGDAFTAVNGDGGDPAAHIHPDAHYSLFGPSGTKEQLCGRAAFLDFVARCSAALSDRSDEILAITGIDEQCALVHARAWRKSAATGEEARYEWAMLYRVEDGLVTYGADMLDADAQAFWGKVLG
jgi:ketosteroid isomerase-like protein